MVLRRDGAVVYGYTTTSTPLVLSLTSKNLAEESYDVKRSPQNKNLWSVKLNPRSAGGEYNISLSNEDELISLIQNVTFGEVFLCVSNLRDMIDSENKKEIKGSDVRVHIVAPNPEPYEQIATKISPQPEWISSISMLGKTSMGKLANLCARSHRSHNNMPVGIYISLYADSEFEAWYPALEQLKCIGESRCVGRMPIVPLSESNYMQC